MKYMVVRGYSIEELESEVMEYLTGGWRLCGGVAVGVYTDPDHDPCGHPDYNFTLYFQALRKSEEGGAK
jgi:hypothetical protein